MFRKQRVELPGFKYEVCFLKELSIAQLKKMPKPGELEDVDLLLKAVEMSLVNEAGDRVFNESYSIDKFADEAPQSYINVLAEAFSKLNTFDDDDVMGIAKNS